MRLVLLVNLTLSLLVAEDIPSRPERYQELANVLFQPTFAGDEKTRSALAQEWSPPGPEVAREHRKVLCELVRETVVESLDRPLEKVRIGELTDSIRNLQGGLHEKLRDLPKDLPYAFAGSIKGQEAIVVAFQILQGPSAILEPEPYIHFYMRGAANSWYLAATAPQDLSGLAIQALRIESPVENEIWVLASGRRYGDNRAKVYARVFAFDGASVRTVWQRDELRGGTVQHQNDRLIITYYDAAKWGLDPPNIEEYQITRNGLVRKQ